MIYLTRESVRFPQRRPGWRAQCVGPLAGPSHMGVYPPCWDSPDIIWSSDSHDRSWSGTLYITSAGPWARRRSSRLAAACDISFTRVPSSPSVKPLRYLSSCAGSSRENRAWVLRVRSAVELLAEAWFQTGVSNARFSKTPTPCISPPIKAMLALAQNLLRAAPSMSETCCLW